MKYEKKPISNGFTIVRVSGNTASGLKSSLTATLLTPSLLTPIKITSKQHPTIELKRITKQNGNIAAAPPSAPTRTILYLKYPPLSRRCLMSRPIPDLRHISKLDGPERDKDKSYFDVAVEKISRNRPSRNLVLGTATGWLAGAGAVKVGKIAAFGLGGGILLLHFACEWGYIHVNWERVKEAGRQSQDAVDAVFWFVRRNSCYSVGFVGGFFFGIASA